MECRKRIQVVMLVHLNLLCVLGLKCGVGVGEQLLEVCLEPSSGLGSGLQGISQTAVSVVSGRGSIGGTLWDMSA
jgi:hypothetical protein